MTGFFQDPPQAAVIAAYVVTVLLCLGGILLSCLSIGGTWVVGAAALLMAWASGESFPGVWTVVIFFVLAGLGELMEALAGSWGVRKRGGSKTAGWMALLGGILGMIVGAFVIPVPIIGSLIGMMVGSFALVFLVERRRLQHDGQAASIAMGAVIARVLVVLLKVGLSLGMSIFLLLGWMLGHGSG